VLGPATSGDETSAAVLDGDNRILGHGILSQDVHEVYGGVVPELAARAHLQKVDAVVTSALERAGVGLEDIEEGKLADLDSVLGWLLRVQYRLFVDGDRRRKRSPVQNLGPTQATVDGWACDRPGPEELADGALRQTQLDQAWQPAGNLAACARAIAEHGEHPDATLAPIVVGYEHLAPRLRERAAMCDWGAERGANVRRSFDRENTERRPARPPGS